MVLKGPPWIKWEYCDHCNTLTETVYTNTPGWHKYCKNCDHVLRPTVNEEKGFHWTTKKKKVKE